MSQRASLRVPAPSPATSLNLGTAWGAMDWTSDGFSATTRGRIWLEAHGAKGSSSLSILSNGPDGVGQLLQSLERHVHLAAKGTTVAAANGSLLVAGRQSVKLYGNLGLDPMELLMPLTGEDPPVRHVHPSETDPSANGARALVTEYERVADHWAIGEAITLGLATTATYVRKMLGAAGSGDTQGFASTVAGLAASATVFSGLASAARLLDDEVPGLHVSSFGGINIGTPAFAALYGGAAALVTGGLFNAFGLDTHAIAGVNAGLRSMFYVKVEGSEVEATAGVDVEMASRADYVKLYGSQIAIGSTVPTAPLQLPTDTCTTSVAGPVLLGANMGRVFLSSQGAVEMSAPEVAVKTLEGIAIRHPGYVIEVSPTGVTLQVLSSSVRVDSTLVDAQIGPSTLSAGNTLQIACGGSELEATNTGATLNGPVVVFSLMQVVRDTPLEHAALYWPVDPPNASMIVVVKATFALEASRASLATTQPPVTGEVYWDDDTDRSVRYPSDLALMKPRGECFVIGSCRPHTGRAEPRTVAAFRVGPIGKRFVVIGDRAWNGSTPGAPVPFTEMPLCWERAFGGPGVADNPIGTDLPNVELEGAPITTKGARVASAGAFPIAMRWPARARHAGTYDERWRETRYPWLPADFSFAFYNEAPADQQIDGAWPGEAIIELTNLHPTEPEVATRLPRIQPRVFVEHDERSATPDAFEEIGLLLDTIVIDADAGTATCVWRGRKPLSSPALEPTGLRRLFTMHEDPVLASSVAACRARMDRSLAAAEAEKEARRPQPAPDLDDAVTRADATEEDLTAARATAVAAAASARAAAAYDIEAKIADLKARLVAAGVDVDAAAARDLAALPAEEPPPPTRAQIEKLLADIGMVEEDVAEDVDALMALIESREREPAPSPEPPPAPDLRAIVIDCHARGVRLVGDFTRVDLGTLDLRGLDARGAILTQANLRGANLEGALFDDATLIEIDGFRARLGRASLQRADLTGAALEEAWLAGARLDRADLSRADLSGATLDEAQLGGAQLGGARLDGATLRKAQAAGAQLEGASLAAADLSGADLTEARVYGVQAKGLILDGADLTKVRVGRGADLSGASIRGARAVGSLWREAILGGVVFTGSALGGADFGSADLTGADLGGCSMRRAIFQGADLSGANLALADVFEGTFEGAELAGADLRGASLYSCNFYRARGRDVKTEGANVDGTLWEAR